MDQTTHPICQSKTTSALRSLIVVALGLGLMSCHPSASSQNLSKEGMEPVANGTLAQACSLNQPSNEVVIFNHKGLFENTARQISVDDNGCVQAVVYQPNGLVVSDIRSSELSLGTAKSFMDKWKAIVKTELANQTMPIGATEGDIYSVHIISQARANSSHLNLSSRASVQSFIQDLDSIELPSEKTTPSSPAMQCERVSDERAKGISQNYITPIETVKSQFPKDILYKCIDNPGIFITFSSASTANISGAIKEGMFQSKKGLVQFAIYQPAHIE